MASLLVLAPATTAVADPALSVSLDPVGVDGAVATVSGSAAMSNALGLDQVTAVTVTVTSRQHPATRTSCDDCASLGQSQSSFSFTTPALVYNGPYDVSVDASGKKVLASLLNGAPVSTRATEAFNVEVAPASPANVAAVANADRSVTVSWSRNTEADLVGYQVQRRGPGSSAFQPLGSAIVQPPDGSRVQWTDTTTAPTGGSFAYLVVAVRPDGNGEVSDRAVSASPPAAVSVPVSPGGPGAPGAPGVGVAGGPAAPGGIATPGPGGAFTTGSPAPLDLSSFLTTSGGAPPKVSVPGGATLPDGTFSASLPFGANSSEVVGSGSVEILGHSASRRTLLVPIATGLLMCVAALHLRRFNRQVLAPVEH